MPELQTELVSSIGGVPISQLELSSRVDVEDYSSSVGLPPQTEVIFIACVTGRNFFVNS